MQHLGNIAQGKLAKEYYHCYGMYGCQVYDGLHCIFTERDGEKVRQPET
jgi:hypothetical protein